MEKYVNEAVEQFRTLLTEQIARQQKMEREKCVTDYGKLDKIVIGICGGDGIGPIISAESERLLEFLLKDEIAAGKIELRTIEGLTIENRIAHAKAIPDDVLAEIKACNVILKAPTTTLKGGTLESANVAMRRELDLYANVRPVCVPEQNIDWTFFRENTEGEYVLGSRGVQIPDTLAFDFKVTTNNYEKIFRPQDLGFEIAKPEELVGGATEEEAAAIFDSVLANKALPAQKNIVLANAGFAIQVLESGKKTIEECIEIARESIDSGSAQQVFKKFVEFNS